MLAAAALARSGAQDSVCVWPAGLLIIAPVHSPAGPPVAGNPAACTAARPVRSPRKKMLRGTHFLAGRRPQGAMHWSLCRKVPGRAWLRCRASARSLLWGCFPCSILLSLLVGVPLLAAASGRFASSARLMPALLALLLILRYTSGADAPEVITMPS